MVESGRKKTVVNLGCGRDYRESNEKIHYINVDKSPNVKKDQYADFEEPICLKWFNNNTVKEVLILDVLEHIKNMFEFMQEVWRVCVSDAKVIISVPYWSHYQSAMDPTHVRQFHEGTFGFFSKKVHEENAKMKTQMTPMSLDFDFEVKQITFIPAEEFKDLKAEELLKLKDERLNVIEKMVVELKVIK